ncbi:hypothetical protein [Pediococcus damnosus]|nr:hypothetical protein [Pediococcus damnosus]
MSQFQLLPAFILKRNLELLKTQLVERSLTGLKNVLLGVVVEK